MKFPLWVLGGRQNRSHPSRGAWIEIPTQNVFADRYAASHPSRGAWIEISLSRAITAIDGVAPLTGCVD